MNRRFIGGRLLVTGPTGRAVLLRKGEDPETVRARVDSDPETLARDLVESGLLNWTGPETMVMAVCDGDEAMSPETAKACVDAAFSTPRPTLTLEFVDEGGRGWPAAWFAIEYAQRRAEWGNRGLGLVYRTSSAPSPELAARLAQARVAVRSALRADGAPGGARLFSAARARVVVGRGASNPEGWVDALAAARVAGVEWVPSREIAPAKFESFTARALARMIDLHETSNLRDETLVALLRARPWEIPGVDVLSTLAFGPDGRVFSSEEGLRLAADGDALFALGHCSAFRFQDLPSNPLVPALVAAATNAAQPLCARCVYKNYCTIPPSAHYRGQGSLAGRLPDSPACRARLALLDSLFCLFIDEKALKSLQKWGVDISRFTC